MTKSIAEIEAALKDLPFAEECVWADDRYYNGGIQTFIENALDIRPCDRDCLPAKVWGCKEVKYSLPSALAAAELAWEIWAGDRTTSDVADVLIDQMIERYFEDVDVDDYAIEHLGETELRRAIEKFVRANSDHWNLQYPNMNTGKLIGLDDLQEAIDTCSALYPELVSYDGGYYFVELTPEWWANQGWEDPDVADRKPRGFFRGSEDSAVDATFPIVRGTKEAIEEARRKANGKS